MPLYPVTERKSPFKSSVVGGASFTIGAEGSNAITVNVQLTGQYGRDLTQRARVGWYLSADANGDALASAVDSVAAGTDGIVVSNTTGLHGWAVSEADGDIDLVITEADATPTVYLVIVLPNGSLAVSSAIVFA